MFKNHTQLLGLRRRQINRLQRARKIFAPIHRQLQLQADQRTGKTLKIRQLFQWPINTGRRHLQPLVIHIFDLKHIGQLATSRFAILHRDIALMLRIIHKYTNQAICGALQIHQLITQTSDGLLN